ncbi:hypothetical protein C8Q80DRAFT_1118313 [Daedaleopsis nitida]|nr:hypothetical protein C8Q80DRAFT_1118313 [Daedaleopsis nitida]
MKAFFALVASALVATIPVVVADVVPAGSAAHFFTSQRDGLVLTFEGAFSGASLTVTAPGDGSSNDITALFPTQGTGKPGQLAYGDFCISADGVEPGTSTQTLYIEDCSDSPKQIWTVNESPATISNADGNCITLGRAAQNVPVTLGACTDTLQHLQLWDAVVV